MSCAPTGGPSFFLARPVVPTVKRVAQRRHMAVQTGIDWRWVISTLVALTVSAPAQEVAPATTDVVRPSVEEAARHIPPQTAPDNNTREAMCLMIESAASANDLPLEFFARVIWQESRFQSDAVGPVTRSGKRALGIAQFMPGTASERRLLDPFDPVQALPKSAEFLSELLSQFGNLGLAAAAYHAGPRRGVGRRAGGGRGGCARELRARRGATPPRAPPPPPPPRGGGGAAGGPPAG